MEIFFSKSVIAWGGGGGQGGRRQSGREGKRCLPCWVTHLRRRSGEGKEAHPSLEFGPYFFHGRARAKKKKRRVGKCRRVGDEGRKIGNPQKRCLIQKRRRGQKKKKKTKQCQRKRKKKKDESGKSANSWGN